MSLESIENRLRALEDIEEIKKLKARYSVYCDEDYDPDGLASLFAEDGVWDGGARGRADGREQVRALFSGMAKVIPFAVHMVMNPVIEVDGDTAKGTWYFLGALTVADGNQALWTSLWYDEEYVRVDGEWKFKRLKVNPFFSTPFDQGWAKTRFA
jgi:ketosteroid isomerase-like protein